MKIYHNFDLTNYNSFRLSSIAKVAYFPESICDLRYILSCNQKYPILADGTNVLLSPQIDKIICLLLMPIVFNKQTNRLSVTANVKLQSLVSYSISKSLSGFEELWGIPGSIGGAVMGNAGSGKSEISDNLYCVKTINHYGQIKTYFKQQLNFRRRYCLLSKLNEIIIQVWFDIPKGQTDKIKLNKAKKWRKSLSTQPSAGGIFKQWHALKPFENKLRALKLNNVSFTNHINILVNNGNATYFDVIDAIEKIQNIVGTTLILEVKIL